MGDGGLGGALRGPGEATSWGVRRASGHRARDPVGGGPHGYVSDGTYSGTTEDTSSGASDAGGEGRGGHPRVKSSASVTASGGAQLRPLDAWVTRRNSTEQGLSSWESGVTAVGEAGPGVASGGRGEGDSTTVHTGVQSGRVGAAPAGGPGLAPRRGISALAEYLEMTKGGTPEGKDATVQEEGARAPLVSAPQGDPAAQVGVPDPWSTHASAALPRGSEAADSTALGEAATRGFMEAAAGGQRVGGGAVEGLPVPGPPSKV